MDMKKRIWSLTMSSSEGVKREPYVFLSDVGQQDKKFCQLLDFKCIPD